MTNNKTTDSVGGVTWEALSQLSQDVIQELMELYNQNNKPIPQPHLKKHLHNLLTQFGYGATLPTKHSTTTTYERSHWKPCATKVLVQTSASMATIGVINGKRAIHIKIDGRCEDFTDDEALCIAAFVEQLAGVAGDARRRRYQDEEKINGQTTSFTLPLCGIACAELEDGTIAYGVSYMRALDSLREKVKRAHNTKGEAINEQ